MTKRLHSDLSEGSHAGSYAHIPHYGGSRDFRNTRAEAREGIHNSHKRGNKEVDYTSFAIMQLNASGDKIVAPLDDLARGFSQILRRHVGLGEFAYKDSLYIEARKALIEQGRGKELERVKYKRERAR